MHRETLEIRLATEELWVQLAGAAPPAALTRSLGRIRSKLADHYRLATAELQEQKTELESLRGQMSAQYEKLVQQKRQYDQWAAAQRDEAQQHAARLMAREETLREKEAAFDDRAHRWQSERLQFQHEIRRLQARAPRQTEASLTA
jgi:chromosome segregation ATPase